MRLALLLTASLAVLLMSAAAAAADEMRDEPVAPGLHFSVSFGGSSAPALAMPGPQDAPFKLNDAASTGSVSTGTWVVLGVLVVAVIVVVASHHGGGGGSGSGSHY